MIGCLINGSSSGARRSALLQSGRTLAAWHIWRARLVSAVGGAYAVRGGLRAALARRRLNKAVESGVPSAVFVVTAQQQSEVAVARASSSWCGSSRPAASAVASFFGPPKPSLLRLPWFSSSSSLADVVRDRRWSIFERRAYAHSLASSKGSSAFVPDSRTQSLAKKFGRTHAEVMKAMVYCCGSLLEAVQKSRLFRDCKHFVDMPLKFDAESTLTDWQSLVAKGQVDNTMLREFVEKHFDEPGGELEDVQPSDFDPEWKKFESINPPLYRQWAKELHRKWPTLCRKVSERVLANPNQFSLIPLPKPFVVPGGRFREMYYWDSFFTIKGLLASGMHDTVRGMIENMGHLIEEFGYVPNGNRVYYLNRSQPPLLTWCLAAYYEATGDIEFLEKGCRWFEMEFDFFHTRRSIQLPGVVTPLYRYCVVADGPRPESYREDMESAEHIEDLLEKRRLWGDIAAAAESGRDFSSRWFSREGPVAGKMGSTRTSSILPVDLNAIICGNWRIMERLYAAIGSVDGVEKCRLNFDAMREAIHQVFWNETNGCWFDYDIVTGAHVSLYMDTNFFPLFTGCTHDGFDGSLVATYLANAGVLNYPGGLPSSLIASGEQWDFPNAWAPTTWVIIQGLRASGQVALARQIAEKWIRRNYEMWINSGGRMFEKYNVEAANGNSAAGGGEYEVQEGFGWTNGVILDLLLTYGPEMTITVNPDNGDSVECKLQ